MGGGFCDNDTPLFLVLPQLRGTKPERLGKAKHPYERQPKRDSPLLPVNTLKGDFLVSLVMAMVFRIALYLSSHSIIFKSKTYRPAILSMVIILMTPIAVFCLPIRIISFGCIFWIVVCLMATL